MDVGNRPGPQRVPRGHSALSSSQPLTCTVKTAPKKENSGPECSYCEFLQQRKYWAEPRCPKLRNWKTRPPPDMCDGSAFASWSVANVTGPAGVQKEEKRVGSM